MPQPTNFGQIGKAFVFLNEYYRHLSVAATITVFLCALGVSPKSTADEPIKVEITATFIDVHSGPGNGYPIVNALEQGEVVELLKQRTGWVKIVNKRGRTGWVKASDINQSKGVNGETVAFTTPGIDQFPNRRFELGFAAGDFEGSDLVNIYLGWHPHKNLALELHASEIVGDFSDSRAYTANIVLKPFPTWRLSPFVTLGGGTINIQPDTNLVDTQERNNNILQAGIGLNLYVSHRFVARLQYNNNKLITDRDDNEEIDEWRFGLTAFY